MGDVSRERKPVVDGEIRLFFNHRHEWTKEFRATVRSYTGNVAGRWVYWSGDHHGNMLTESQMTVAGWVACQNRPEKQKTVVLLRADDPSAFFRAKGEDTSNPEIARRFDSIPEARKFATQNSLADYDPLRVGYYVVNGRVYVLGR
jgi:hypothetical protein